MESFRFKMKSQTGNKTTTSERFEKSILFCQTFFRSKVLLT